MNRRSIIVLVALGLALFLAMACALGSYVLWQTLQEDNESVSLEDFMAALDVVETQVIELRGLEPKQDVPRVLLTEDELRQHVLEDLEEEYSPQEARDDTLTLAAFGFVEPDLDLYTLFVDLYTEQIAGFYDSDEKTIYVVSRGKKLGAIDRTTFAHEFNHALQDQHFNLERFGVTEDEQIKKELDLDSEAEWAGLALIEGDAVLLETQHMFNYFESEDWEEIFIEIAEMDTSVMDAAPTIIQETMLFPYNEGQVFVEHLYNQGGWAAVNAAFENPPVSTEQILHPERYPDDAPQAVSLPPLTDTLGGGWHKVDEDILGEFQLRLYLDLYLQGQVASEAAEGWDGDRYAAYWNEDDTQYVLLERITWDSETDVSQFWTAYAEFAQNRYDSPPTRRDTMHQWWLDGQDVTLLAQNPALEMLIIVAPDEPTLQAAYALFPDF